MKNRSAPSPYLPAASKLKTQALILPRIRLKSVRIRSGVWFMLSCGMEDCGFRRRCVPQPDSRNGIKQSCNPQPCSEPDGERQIFPHPRSTAPSLFSAKAALGDGVERNSCASSEPAKKTGTATRPAAGSQPPRLSPEYERKFQWPIYNDRSRQQKKSARLGASRNHATSRKIGTAAPRNQGARTL